MHESQHRAATKQLEDKLLRQEQAVEATKGMLELLKSTQIDKQTGKK